jgi:hypothetical protein
MDTDLPSLHSLFRGEFLRVFPLVMMQQEVERMAVPSARRFI